MTLLRWYAVKTPTANKPRQKAMSEGAKAASPAHPKQAVFPTSKQRCSKTRAISRIQSQNRH
jgi:hypothetical protein